MNKDFARRQMVQQQVRAWDVLDHRILDVISKLPREKFVPPGFERLAFADLEIPLGHGQHMMTPTLEGRLLQELAVSAHEDVLEIGTGSGFLCACLALLGASVTSIDIYQDFVDRAGRVLAEAEIDNAELMCMDATRDLPSRQYDAIAVTGSLPMLDPRFVDALKPGGRLFVVTGEAPVMDARLVERTADNEWRSRSLFETCIAPLVNAAAPQRFSF